MKMIAFAFTLLMSQTHAIDPVKPSATSLTMQDLYQSLSQILTLSSNPEKFESKGNHSEIETQLKKISELSHNLKKDSFSGPKGDPTAEILAGYLINETQNAYLSFKNGKKAYARSIIRSLPGTCIACHSRSNFGPQFDKLALEPADSSLKPIEMAEFFAATRQFDRALKDFLSIIENKESSETDPYAWEHALHQSLTIAIRVKRDPGLAMKIIDTALAQKKTAFTVREDLRQWKKSIQEWLKEPKPASSSENSLLKEGKRLLTEAEKLQKYPMDHSADLLYLRASSMFYDVIQKYPNGKETARALYQQGLCNEILSPRGFEDLHRFYYEACIRKSPHSTLAIDCYKRFEQSTIQGYTGSAGISVPEEIKQKLLDLFSLSMPKSMKQNYY